MIVSEPIFWMCAGFSAALAGFAHYVLKHYHWCVEDWRLVARYIIGVVCIALGFAGWYVDHPHTTAKEVVGVIALLTISVGATTVLAYAVDNTWEREHNEADLRNVGFRTKD